MTATQTELIAVDGDWVTCTTDPVVAVLYGAMAYPSLRAGITTAVDLVAGQSGPWPMPTDPPRARLAIDLVARLQAGDTTAPAETAAVAVAPAVVNACEEARRQLTDMWARCRNDMPTALRHDVETLEARLVDFLDRQTQALTNLTVSGSGLIDEATETGNATPPVAPPVPSREEAESWRLDQWLALFKAHRLDHNDVLSDAASAITAKGKRGPTRVRDVVTHKWMVPFLLEAITTRIDKETRP